MKFKISKIKISKKAPWQKKNLKHIFKENEKNIFEKIIQN